MANTDSKAPRITKTQRFEDIIAILNGEDAPNGSTIEDIWAFINHEVELLSKKNTSADKRKSKENEANERFMADILDFLSVQPSDFAGMTCTEIGKNVPSCVDFNTSKMSSLCHSLVKRGAVVNVKKGDKSLFKVA